MSYTKTDLKGKTALVTGATSGIGEITATAMANMGATVYLVCRNREKGQRLAENIKQSANHDRVHLIIADLGEQAQVRAAAQGGRSLSQVGQQARVDGSRCYSGHSAGASSAGSA